MHLFIFCQLHNSLVLFFSVITLSWEEISDMKLPVRHAHMRPIPGSLQS